MYMSQGASGGMVADLRGPGPSVTEQRLRPGTIRRMLSYATPYRWELALLLLITVVDSLIIVVIPLLLKGSLDKGIRTRDVKVVVLLAVVAAALAVLDALVQLGESYYSARIGQCVAYDLRTQVFSHVQRQPIAFFTRTQTGSLVSRLNTDVVGAQQALSALLVSAVSSVLTLALVLAEMFYLSWLVSVIALAMMPAFIIPGRLIGRRLQRYSREQMQLNAEMGATMNERFNVARSMLTKLFGRPPEEAALFASRAGKVRDIGVSLIMSPRPVFIPVQRPPACLIRLLSALRRAPAFQSAFC